MVSGTAGIGRDGARSTRIHQLATMGLGTRSSVSGVRNAFVRDALLRVESEGVACLLAARRRFTEARQNVELSGGPYPVRARRRRVRIRADAEDNGPSE